jgi:YVTN family beta-propeller protein
VISPNGETAYVANMGSGTVTPIDTATNTAGSPITVGTEPIAIAFTPDSATAYVVNFGPGPGTVSPVDVATGTAGPPITVGYFPRSVVVAPSGTTAFVANGANASVTPITVATNKAGAGIRVGGGPVFLAVKR